MGSQHLSCRADGRSRGQEWRESRSGSGSAEPWLALVQERPHAFALVRGAEQVAEERHLARQPLGPGRQEGSSDGQLRRGEGLSGAPGEGTCVPRSGVQQLVRRQHPFDESQIRRLAGGPGTTLLLNCRAVHGSAPNAASAARPLLLPVYSSADSFPITPSPIPSPHQGDIVRGRPARFASIDTRPVEMPPDWRGGYKPVWMHKNKDETPYLVPNVT